jgi:hypothetical protein
MSFTSWLQNLRSALTPRRGQRYRGRPDSRRTPAHRPSLEALEDRCLLTFTPIASYAGEFVLAADFNNDNVPDIVRSAGSVLLGNGDGTFTPAPGPAVYGTAVGDLDGDGNLDLVATSGSEVNVLMGNGDGTFTAGSVIIVAEPDASLGGVAVGDFNGDGFLDLGVTSNVQESYYDYWTYSYSTRAVSSAHVLLGNGSGGFSEPNTTAVGYGYLRAAAVGDVNGDGRDDLVTISDSWWVGPVRVLPGHASGFLQTPIAYDTPGQHIDAVAFADMDGDLVTDMVIANHNSAYAGVRVMHGNGSFYGMSVTDNAIYTYQTSSGVGAAQTSGAVADFNGDGKLDIVTTSNAFYTYSNAPTGQSHLNILLGYGDGSFAPAMSQLLDPGMSSPQFVAANDFDSDGLADLAMTTYVAGSYQVNVLLNAGDWNLPTTVSIGDATVIEGDNGTVDAVFTVTRRGSLDDTLTVSYYTGGGDATAGSDFVAQSGTLIFGPGEATKNITIQVKGDLIDEYNQVFGVHFNEPTGAIATDRDGICTIVDNDPPPTVTITPTVSAKEGHSGSKALKFVVTLSAPSEKEVRVNFATGDGTASTADNDYVANSGTLIFAPGQTSKTISVTVKGDRKQESNETFVVNLTAATNATIISSLGIGEILDDDNSASKANRK